MSKKPNNRKTNNKPEGSSGISGSPKKKHKKKISVSFRKKDHTLEPDPETTLQEEEAAPKPKYDPGSLLSEELSKPDKKTRKVVSFKVSKEGHDFAPLEKFEADHQAIAEETPETAPKKEEPSVLSVSEPSAPLEVHELTAVAGNIEVIPETQTPIEEEKEEKTEEEFLSPDEFIQLELSKKKPEKIAPETQEIELDTEEMAQLEHGLKFEPPDAEEEFLSPEEMWEKTYGDRKIKTPAEKLIQEQVQEIPPAIELEKKEPVVKKDDYETEELLLPPEELEIRPVLAGKPENAIETSIEADGNKETAELAELETYVKAEEKEESVLEKPQVDLSRHRVFTPSDITEEEKITEIVQLENLGPITQKKDVLSPDDIMESGELEEDFGSQALPVGTVLSEQYKIIKVVKERADRNTYVVKDIKITDKTLILKEFIPGKMSKEEYRSRRNRFQDNLWIIQSFDNPNLARIYKYFTENYREYYVMERVDGLTLEKLSEMNTRHFAEKEVVRWGLTLCDTIEFLHYRPKPFTLTSLNPNQVMVSTGGELKITNYDMQRFFNPNRTLEFMHDDPTRLYTDITYLARLLFFLLTKEYYKEGREVEWSEDVSEKLRKLLEITCREGQKTYGDIKDFRRKLEKTQRDEDEQAAPKKYNFSFKQLNFSFVKDLYLKFIDQEPHWLWLEGTAVFAIIVLFFLFYLAGRGYMKPSGMNLAYVAAGPKLVLVNQKTREAIHSTEMPYKIKEVIKTELNLLVREELGEKKHEKKEVLIIIDDSGIGHILDTRDLKEVDTFSMEKAPQQLILDEDKKILYALYPGDATIKLIDMETLKVKDIFPVGLEPTYMLLRKKTGETGAEKAEKKPVEWPEEFLIVGIGNGSQVAFFETDNGKMFNRMGIEGKPGPMLFSQNQEKIYLLTTDTGKILKIDYKKLKTQNAYKAFSGKNPTSMAMVPFDNDLWLSLTGENKIQEFQLDTDKVGEELTILENPGKIYYNRAYDELWIFKNSPPQVIIYNLENKNQSIIDLDNIPSSLTEF